MVLYSIIILLYFLFLIFLSNDRIHPDVLVYYEKYMPWLFAIYIFLKVYVEIKNWSTWRSQAKK